MKGELLDDFEDLSGWHAITSGQARIDISPGQGHHGKAMRLDFDFQGGGGFVGARKPISLTLPETYAFSFGIRGISPSNVFEFKLVDESGQNVWRYRQEALEFPGDWQTLRIKSSQIAFAWGPLGGGPARHAAAIEWVIAAGPGGQGTVWIDDLRFEDETYRLTPIVQASSALTGYEPEHVIDPSAETGWRSQSSDAPQQLHIDFQTEREYGYLPIPSSEWKADEMILKTTAFATGKSDQSKLYLRYRLENTSAESRRMRFFAALRPFQVTPTWQNWHAFGGVSKITDLEYRPDGIWVNRNKQVIPLTPPSQFGAARFAQGPITEYLKTGELPPQTAVSDDFGYASGALRYDLDLAPGAVQEIYLAIPFGTVDMAAMQTASPVSRSGSEQFDVAVRQWKAKLSVPDIRLPPEVQGVASTLKTAAAHILINRDGPALQPGPRRYSRSWIRDGALMGAALLRMGWSEEMRDFIRWYAGFQTADGNLPDCVDREGCEWLPEYDSWGEFIFAIMDYYRFRRDEAFLAGMWPAVLKSVNFMENLRSQRLTAPYQTPEKRACYGLLPESVSHEGYMAHPVHAYWDDFWALRGLKDAVTMAEILGDQDVAQRLSAFRESFCATLYASLNSTIQDCNLDFVPGSVEFADFDPAATAVAIGLVDELHHLPQPAIGQTFDKYLIGFRERVRGDIPWNNYSAYEIRIIGALIRLGRRQEAHELLDFFLADRRIIPWNQWPEISWRDPKGPSFIGDMPQTWIRAEYILSVRSLFAYEREEDQALVIAAGIHEKWLSDSREVVVADLPTHYGNVSYTLRREGLETLRVIFDGDLTMPPGKVVVKPPLPRPLVQVEVNGRKSDTFDSESVTCGECPAEIVMTY